MFRKGDGGDLWAALPVDRPAPGCLTPSLLISSPFPHYQQDYAPPQAAVAPRQPVVWTEEENRVFEAALVELHGASEDELCRSMAALIVGKTPEDVREHYRRLVQDVMDIEAGVVELPRYADDCCERDKRRASPGGAEACCSHGGGLYSGRQGQNLAGGGAKAKPEERKKGIPWTEEEHRRFLEGLEKYGKGDWRSISRNSVVTRTPTQVASHAQKYFLRQSTESKKDRRRSSIHDVTRH